ncbi:MAG: SDR family oxidoreductase, partial [Nocardioidaceae bacterium]
NLVLTARRVDRLEALKAELDAAHPQVEVLARALDVNDHDRVFAVVEQAAADLGGLDRVVVNAGVGKGGRIGTGRFAANAETATTDFVAALAQCEAAMAHFYERGSGHLVVISSVSAMRGMPGAMTTYAASKAGLAHLAEGIRADLVNRKGHDIKVSTIYPGYIATELNESAAQEIPLMVDAGTGCRAIVRQIDNEVAEASVPPWPWRPIAFVLRHAPLSVVRRMV